MLRPVRRVEVAVGVEDSRFLALLARADDPDAAHDVLRARADEHSDATHHCWAYRVWTDGGVEGIGFDAGEPSGTAGRPILGALERPDLVQAACVVTRWFGGTKLGTGGLKRAYAKAAAGAVSAARDAGALEPVAERALFELGFAYERTSAVRRVLAAYGARERAGDYGAAVELTASVAVERAGAFARALSEATGDAVRAHPAGTRLEPL